MSKLCLPYVKFLACFCLLTALNAQGAEIGEIDHDAIAKTILVTDASQNLSLLIDYSQGCKISRINTRGENTLSPSGVYTGIKTGKGLFSSTDKSNKTRVTEASEEIEIAGIVYGDESITIRESWSFKIEDEKILWSIVRDYSTDTVLEEMAFPVWNFANLSVWKGGIFDNGGMVWSKYFRKNDTYGVHTGGVTFWNPDSGNAFRITPRAQKGKYLAAKYTQTEAGEFSCTQFLTDSELGQRYHLNRFVGERTNVFAPFAVRQGEVVMHLELQYVDYAKEYSRGTLPGIDATAVRELLNTTGRYGVVDNNIIGANGWITNWKCLHEPFFAQIGMALNDENYTKHFSSTLDQERDLAMLENGRVLSRWHNAPGDEIPGTYNVKTGYYEARWGYTIDSQTGYVINTAEQFDLCGDLAWLQSHKLSCEKALDWLIKRDSNNNGIFEMMNNNIAEQKASDWLDIVWASFENAFVNAQMYEALNLWANCEMILGDKDKSDYYLNVAARLKASFNKPVSEGGFWLPEKQQYVYWRDNDGSIHGDNLVTPVNFAAIAFKICDDEKRTAAILDQIEKRTVAENLFHWPLCFDSFKREEVQEGNWPFPRYENGDIFPTWGYLGIRAYANHNKAIALKYIRNILEQYNKDGLSSQRYSRTTQLGLGSDILAGISTTVTALYRDIYGIRPKWNRMGIEPNLSETLNGTDFEYTLRGIVYRLRLSVDDYTMSSSDFSIKSKRGFGASMNGRQLIFYPDNKEEMRLAVTRESTHPINIEIGDWNNNDFSWTVASKDKYQFAFEGLNPNAKYELSVNNKSKSITAEKDGTLSFSHESNDVTAFSLRTVSELNH